MMTPLASPMKKAISSMQTYLEEVGHLTKLDPQDSWLPITESRNGNACYAAFHTLSSGIGFQALLLPLAFTTLGWVWGIISLSLVFVWQLYTLWLLIQLHESVPGTRYSRYLRLSMAAFGEKLGKLLALFPTLYLAGGTCVSLIMMGGSTLKIFFHTVCGTTCNPNSLSTVEWYIVFVCSAVILAQLPNLNSIAGVSLIGAITAVTYCTLTWLLSVVKTRPSGNHAFFHEESIKCANVERSESFISNHPCCLFPMAIGAIGHMEICLTEPISLMSLKDKPCIHQIPANGGMLSALDQYHRNDTSKVFLGLTSLFVVINSLTSFQIYAMPVFDNLEFRYTSNKNGPCPWWLRTGIRVFLAASRSSSL
ncbi:hypothetical protein DH2020_047317 [Rehmannia glutinosa]|uniref:Amino acid transporter transmembrane domain-containing protein n=1 Tax=Rehmannia glutinosa TaxID=99300 RepID=A0ABR0U9K8_REHGL